MQWLFRLLTLIALIAAPLAAPAMAPFETVAPECNKMDSGASHHPMPAHQHRSGEPCCVAVSAAIGPVQIAFDFAPPIGHPTFAAVTVPPPPGAEPYAEDPPPRVA